MVASNPSAGRRIPALALLLATLLALAGGTGAQTWYWHASAAGNEVQKTWNWTSLQNGGGMRPPAAHDDSFNDTAFGLWKVIDSVPKGTGQPATAIAMTGSKLSITAAGADVWVNENQFAGVYQSAVTGALDVTVKIDSRTIADPWSKAGIMIWNDFNDFGKGGGFAVELTGSSGFVVHVDSVDHVWDGGGTTIPGRFDFPTGPMESVYPATTPCWLRAVKRKVDSSWVFTGYYRTDSAGPWIKIRGDYKSQRTSDSAQVGLFVTSHDITEASTVIFDDFQAGGDLASAAYDLSFGGTGDSADVNAILGANVTANSVNFAGYTGAFSFGGWTLGLTGAATFSSTMSILPATGTLEMKGGSGVTQFLTPKTNDTLPRLLKSGAGTVQVTAQPLLADSLRITGGTFDFGGHNAHLARLAGTGGTLRGLAAGDTLFLHGDADFTGLTNSFTGGVVAVKSTGNGRTVAFNPAGKPFPSVTLWTHPTGTNKAAVRIGPGALDVRGDLVFRSQRGALSGQDGITDFNDHNPDVTVADSVLQVLEGTGVSWQPVHMGRGRWRVGGSVAFSLRGGSHDSSTLELNGPANRTQRLAVTDLPLHAVTHASASTLRLGATLAAHSLTQSGPGVLDFNNRSVRLTGDLAVTGGGSAVTGLGRDTLAVGGNAVFKGLASGRLMLSSFDRWVIDVEGSLTADSAEIGNSDARPGTTGQATASVDREQNLNWSFDGGIPTAPAVVTAEPRDTTVILGQKATFAAAVSGHGPFQWKWFRRGDTAVVSTDSLLRIDSAAFADSGWYRAIVTNSSGKDTTVEARLRVLPQPVGVLVLRDPADVTVRVGGKAVFSLGVSGTRPIAYEWRRRGDTAVLSVDSTLTLDKVSDSLSGGSYYVTVSNLDGAARDTSGEARLTVRVCDSLTVAVSPDTAVDEGRPVSIFGKAGCADGFAWSALSGPAPRINDPGVDTLRFAAPRVAGDTVIRYQFSAYAGGATLERVVEVRVREAIPDPRFTLPAESAWDGLKPLAVKPSIANRADLEKFPAHPLRYAWSVEPLLSDSALAADSLTLKDPVEDGQVRVTLCLDNGGAGACDTTVIDVKRTPVGLASALRLPGGLTLADGMLRFGQAGRVRLYDWRGRLLFEARGRAGEARALPADALRAFRAYRARLVFTP